MLYDLHPATTDDKRLARLARLTKLTKLTSLMSNMRAMHRMLAKDRRRGPSGPRIQPTTWKEFMANPIVAKSEAMFKRLFRMDKATFEHVVALLRVREVRTGRGSTHGGAPRVVTDLECALAMTLRYLAGGAEPDICIIFKVNEATYRRCLKRTIENLYHALPAFALRPALDRAAGAGSDTSDETVAKLRAIAVGFEAASRGTICGCIGAIDGILFPVEAQNDRRNGKTFYCRKGFHAFNCQVIADAFGRFIYANVGSTPGAFHDSWAWKEDSLSVAMTDPTTAIGRYCLTNGLHLIGDDAYACSHTLAVPWPGNYARDDPKLAYNEIHSSARMSIERAFGMLCRKWLLLKRTFAQKSVRRTKRSAGFHNTVVVAMKLHNLCSKVGGAQTGHVHEPDVTGEPEHAPWSSKRADYLGERRPLDPSTVHLSSENPVLAAHERRLGRKEAAANAAQPAWWPANSSLSPRDPAWGKQVCEPRETATRATCGPREELTAECRRLGIQRRTSVHWK